ncbi:putative Proton-coupled amino acid transporter-like protein pathetic-like 2, partial [Homarus americanus]
MSYYHHSSVTTPFVSYYHHYDHYHHSTTVTAPPFVQSLPPFVRLHHSSVTTTWLHCSLPQFRRCCVGHHIQTVTTTIRRFYYRSSITTIRPISPFVNLLQFRPVPAIRQSTTLNPVTHHRQLLPPFVDATTIRRSTPFVDLTTTIRPGHYCHSSVTTTITNPIYLTVGLHHHSTVYHHSSVTITTKLVLPPARSITTIKSIATTINQLLPFVEHHHSSVTTTFVQSLPFISYTIRRVTTTTIRQSHYLFVSYYHSSDSTTIRTGQEWASPMPEDTQVGAISSVSCKRTSITPVMSPVSYSSTTSASAASMLSSSPKSDAAPVSLMAGAVQIIGITICFYYMLRDLPHVQEELPAAGFPSLYTGSAIYAFEGIGLSISSPPQKKGFTTGKQDEIPQAWRDGRVLNTAMVIVVVSHELWGSLVTSDMEVLQGSITLNLPSEHE